jgi:hypothetical protein
LVGEHRILRRSVWYVLTDVTWYKKALITVVVVVLGWRGSDKYLDNMTIMCYNETMPKRSSNNKTPKDLNKLAAFIVEQTTNEAGEPDDGKNPHAVALGRLGGTKGGVARANKLTPEQRREIAQKAALARWSK